MAREVGVTIDETMTLWAADPEKAKAAPVVTARSEGEQVTLSAGPFTWQTDLPPPLGGRNAAPSPTALLLGALAGCAVVFIRDTLAPQLGVNVESISATAGCRNDMRGLLGMDGAVPDLTDVEIAIQIASPDPEENLDRLYQVWLERCPVYLALITPVPVRTSLSRVSGS
jgi:uncharacterized OsmC-like protein